MDGSPGSADAEDEADAAGTTGEGGGGTPLDPELQAELREAQEILRTVRDASRHIPPRSFLASIPNVTRAVVPSSIATQRPDWLASLVPTVQVAKFRHEHLLGRGSSLAKLTRGIQATRSIADYAKIAELKSPTRISTDGAGLAKALRTIQAGTSAARFTGLADIVGSKALVSDTAFSGLRAALETQAFAGGVPTATLGSHVRSLAANALAADIKARADFNASVLGRIAEVGASRPLFSTRSLGAYQGFLDRAGQGLTVHGREFARTASFGVSGLVGGDALTTPDALEPELIVEEIEVEVIAPWRQAAHDTHDGLYARLEGVHPKVAEMLQGAWDSVARPGPAHIEKIANCAVEAIDRALRHGAPDGDIEGWQPGSGHRMDDLRSDRGNFTKSARVRYLLRDRKGERRLIAAQVDGLCASVDALLSRLQAAKHASAGDLATVKSHLVTAEAILGQIFLEGEDH